MYHNLNTARSRSREMLQASRGLKQGKQPTFHRHDTTFVSLDKRMQAHPRQCQGQCRHSFFNEFCVLNQLGTVYVSLILINFDWHILCVIFTVKGTICLLRNSTASVVLTGKWESGTPRLVQALHTHTYKNHSQIYSIKGLQAARELSHFCYIKHYMG